MLRVCAEVVRRADGRLNQGYQPPLRIAIAVNIPLGGLDGSMTCEQLDVSQGSTGLVHQSRGSRDECTPSRVGRAAVETESLIGALEPDYDTEGFHGAAAFRTNDWSRAGRRWPQG